MIPLNNLEYIFYDTYVRSVNLVNFMILKRLLDFLLILFDHLISTNNETMNMIIQHYVFPIMILTHKNPMLYRGSDLPTVER